MNILPICRPGPFIDYSNRTFIEEPSRALNFIDPINGACDESEHWKWRYYLKQQKYNFSYGNDKQLSLNSEAYHTFANRKATDTRISESKKLTDIEAVLFDVGWSYIGALI